LGSHFQWESTWKLAQQSEVDLTAGPVDTFMALVDETLRLDLDAAVNVDGEHD
jgi:hypothetical protein